MRMPGPIVVIGSINMDLVCRTRAMPERGETILGREFITIAGGKGANQAVAAARLADGRAEVHMIGRVGDDDFGRRLLAGLRQNNVNTDHVRVTSATASGVAMIIVDDVGENSIVVAPGANARLTPADVDRARKLIASASVVVLQLEIPLATVRHAIRLCKRLGVFTILDPAPVPEAGLPRSILSVDLLSPNLTEARMIAGTNRTPRPIRRSIDPKQLAVELLERGARNVVIKLGERGAGYLGNNEIYRKYPAFKVKVVDTTAAGDAFTGALAVGRAIGMSIEQSLPLANAAGAVCCKTFGAQPALPTRAAVDRLLRYAQ